MTHDEALSHMMNIIGQQQEDVKTMSSQEEKDELPQVGKDQYIFKVKLEDHIAIFCCKDLTWSEALDIESKAFKVDEDELYFSGEYERREILKKAIVWVYDLKNEKLLINENGEIITKLTQPFVDELWVQYFKYIGLDAKEANIVYNSALKYFKGESQNGYPVLPIIVEVDYMLKGVISMSREEFKKLTNNELERLQLIMTARADAFGLAAQQQVVTEKKENNNTNFDDELMSTLPPHVRNQMINSNLQ
jgi:hypothetical protein